MKPRSTKVLIKFTRGKSIRRPRMANHDDKIVIKIEFDEGDNYVSLNDLLSYHIHYLEIKSN